MYDMRNITAQLIAFDKHPDRFPISLMILAYVRADTGTRPRD